MGQETIARLITYGGVKQNLWGLTFASAVAPGTVLLDAEGQKVASASESVCDVTVSLCRSSTVSLGFSVTVSLRGCRWVTCLVRLGKVMSRVAYRRLAFCNELVHSFGSGWHHDQL